MFEIALPAGRVPIDGPKPKSVSYPYGVPGDGFRRFAKPYNATCIALHDKVDPGSLSSVEGGNTYRYGPGDQRWDDLLNNLKENGFVGGPGQRIIIHVDKDRAWFAEGNHRMRACLQLGIDAVDVEIRYLNGADEDFLLIPFDTADRTIEIEAD